MRAPLFYSRQQRLGPYEHKKPTPNHTPSTRHYYSTVYYNEKQWFVGESRRVLFTIDHRF